MKISVKFYGVCKDFFNPEQVFDAYDVHELKGVLLNEKPSFGDVLSNCKFIICKDVVQDSYTFVKGDSVLVFPPSSGG